MENQLNMKLQMSCLQKDNWAHFLKCWGAIKFSYKFLHMQQQHIQIYTGLCGCMQAWLHVIHWQTWYPFIV